MLSHLTGSVPFNSSPDAIQKKSICIRKREALSVQTTMMDLWFTCNLPAQQIWIPLPSTQIFYTKKLAQLRLKSVRVLTVLCAKLACLAVFARNLDWLMRVSVWHLFALELGFQASGTNCYPQKTANAPSWKTHLLSLWFRAISSQHPEFYCLAAN